MANSEDPDEMPHIVAFRQGLLCLLRSIKSSGTAVNNYLDISTCDPLKYIMDNPILILFICMGKSIRIQRGCQICNKYHYLKGWPIYTLGRGLVSRTVLF